MHLQHFQLPVSVKPPRTNDFCHQIIVLASPTHMLQLLKSSWNCLQLLKWLSLFFLHVNPREPAQEKGGGFLTRWDSYIGRYFRELGLSMHGLFSPSVRRIRILDFLALVSCGGSVIFSVLRAREGEKKSSLIYDYISLLLLLVLSCAAVLTIRIWSPLTCTSITVLHLMLILLINPINDSHWLI